MSTKIKFKQIAFLSNNKAFIKGDGTFDLNSYAILDENNKIPLDNIPDSVILKACYYEEFINADYTPKLGETIIVIDYIKVNDRNVPSFVIGDGITLLGELIPSGDFAKCSEIAKKLEHSLTIGSYVFDGNEDVVIPTFATVATSGSYNDLSDKPSLNYLPLTGGTMSGNLNMGGKYITNGYMYETSLQWGNEHYQNKRIIDTLLTQPGNRFACTPASHIDVEYSRDNGETWLDYGLTDAKKMNIFTLDNNSICLGKRYNDGIVDIHKDRLRITWWSCKNDITSFYGTLNKFLIKTSISASGQVINTNISKLTIGDYNNNNDNWTTLHNVTHTGWPVERSYNYASGIQTSNGRIDNIFATYNIALRFEFSYDSTSSQQTGTTGAYLYYIKGFGNTIHSHAVGTYGLPFNNQPFTYDSYQNTTFPAKVTSQEPINYDAKIKPTQTGNTVTKTNNWVLQYLTQGVHWLRDNYLPLTGGTLSNDLVLSNGTNAPPKIVFQRNTATDDWYDYYIKALSSGGFQIGYNTMGTGVDKQMALFDYNGGITATKFIKSGGTSSQFLKADGSVDSTSYYSKPSTGIPKTDLASAVQVSLDKADSALQGIDDGSITLEKLKEKSFKINGTEITLGDGLNNENNGNGVLLLGAVQDGLALCAIKINGDVLTTIKSDGEVKSTLYFLSAPASAVATSGDYNDLSNKPNIQAPIGDLNTIRSNATNGNTAYGWGNHANVGYAKQSEVTEEINHAYNTLFDKIPTELPPIDNSVTTAKIVDASISTNKIQDKAIIGSKIGYQEILTDHIANSSITNAKLAKSSITINGTPIALGGIGQILGLVTANGQRCFLEIANNELILSKPTFANNGSIATIEEIVRYPLLTELPTIPNPTTNATEITDVNNWFNSNINSYIIPENLMYEFLSGKNSMSQMLLQLNKASCTLTSYNLDFKMAEVDMTILISNLTRYGYEVYVENDIDSITTSGICTLKFKIDDHQVIIECYRKFN